MPRDAKGNFHLNTQRMMAHEPKSKPSGGMHDPMPHSDENATEHAGGGEGAHIAIRSHGDGTYQTETHDGEREEHPSLGHALMHAAHHHEPDAKHAHVKHDGMSMASHHVGEDGQPQGPHDHENLESLKSHLGKFFDEEEHESDWGEGHGGGDSAGY